MNPLSSGGRLLLFLAVLNFGLGIINSARGDIWLACFNFASSGLCLAFHR